VKCKWKVTVKDNLSATKPAGSHEKEKSVAVINVTQIVKKQINKQKKNTIGINFSG